MRCNQRTRPILGVRYPRVHALPTHNLPDRLPHARAREQPNDLLGALARNLDLGFVDRAQTAERIGNVGLGINVGNMNLGVNVLEERMNRVCRAVHVEV